VLYSDLANIARPHEPLGGLFSALRSSPVRQCMLAGLHMSIYACTYACVGSCWMVWQYVEVRVHSAHHPWRSVGRGRPSSAVVGDHVGTLHCATRGSSVCVSLHQPVYDPFLLWSDSSPPGQAPLTLLLSAWPQHERGMPRPQPDSSRHPTRRRRCLRQWWVAGWLEPGGWEER